MNRPGYIDVDSLQAQTTLEAAAEKCGVQLSATSTGGEVRIDCPFNCPGDHSGRRELAVNTGNDQKIFMCHAYQCGVRGNLLTLMHGWLTGSKPTGDKLKGAEFQRVRKLLAGESTAASPTSSAAKSPSSKSDSPPPKPERNVPLIDSPDERIRELHNIDAKLITDVASMNPAAASYVRQHPCLSTESMEKFRCGYMPNDGGGDKRGWSLRGNIIYPVLSEQGKILTWVGRDVHFADKEREFNRLSPAERAKETPPMKHRFPKGFHRGQELFGQQTSRLREPGYREAIAKNGIVIVEGFNDVIGLDAIGVPAVGIMSNRISAGQVEKISRWSKQLAGGKVVLLFDCEQTGDEGAKEALWMLSQRGLSVRLGWSQAMHGGAFGGRQPESLTLEEWNTCRMLSVRGGQSSA